METREIYFDVRDMFVYELSQGAYCFRLDECARTFGIRERQIKSLSAIRNVIDHVGYDL